MTTKPEVLKLITMDDRDLLANGETQAWRCVAIGNQCSWRRACEGETSRDGLWVVGGGQWRYGC